MKDKRRKKENSIRKGIENGQQKRNGRQGRDISYDDTEME